MIEIERKFIIEMPDIEKLKTVCGYTASDIEQIYLISDRDVTRRIRRRKTDGITRYYETVKRRIDALSAIEDEGEITEGEYLLRKSEIAPDTHPIIKCRHTFPYGEHLFEIDVYPEWQAHAILEVELPSREAELHLPDFIKVVREVTGIKAYSNASMSRSFPPEPEA